MKTFFILCSLLAYANAGCKTTQGKTCQELPNYSSITKYPGTLCVDWSGMKNICWDGTKAANGNFNIGTCACVTGCTCAGANGPAPTEAPCNNGPQAGYPAVTQNVAGTSSSVCQAGNNNNGYSSCTGIRNYFQCMHSNNEAVKQCASGKSSSYGSTCGAVCYRGLTSAEQNLIVNEHNELRARVAKGEETRSWSQQGNQPKAANMRALSWSDDLATLAQAWNDQCTWGHDDNRGIPSESGSVGQNNAMAARSNFVGDKQLAYMVNNWYDEVQCFNKNLASLAAPSTCPGNTDPNGSKAVGHYTQLIWANTSKIGCGYIKFKKDGWYKEHLYCNYWSAGNSNGQAPYIVGNAATQCPSGTSSNSDGLCH